MVSGYQVSFFFVVGCMVCGSLAGDPYVFYDWTVSYLSTFLLEWVYNIGKLLARWCSGTNCPIPAGGYGGIIINNRDVIPLPFGTPDGDITTLLVTGILRVIRKTYRFRVHNVGISTIEFRIQNHNLLLIETEGSYTVQQNYSNMDSCGSIVLILGLATGPLPDPPNDYDTYFSMNQARSIRWNVSAGAARPNPQGSFKYGDYCDRRQFKIPGVYKLDFPNKPMNRPPKLDVSLINGTFKEVGGLIKNSFVFVHILRSIMDFGVWTENSRGTYNKWDGVARSTTQVFPGAWTAILVSLDNAGIWNLRAQNLDSWYLGQEAYVSVVNPEVDNSEIPLPENSILWHPIVITEDQAQRVNFSCTTSIYISSKTRKADKGGYGEDGEVEDAEVSLPGYRHQAVVLRLLN
ncbi:hypothetical protein F3Y22_tig00111105pilonHSYRG00092 [Hibiscus syriacus]|uniref:Uncharacterized protein n=1 Tax=Hibiscus syriacus TaxID=106335 RepID=A0A6A2Z0F7_HIBSY|nr:hypothetical protein F3Y22_tig00111105pilonHSYRG00092 [Hibiscus syriacus]